MEQNNRWVDFQLAKLEPQSGWEPQAAEGLARFEKRRAQSRFSGTRTRLLSIAAVALICIVTFPAPRAFAQRVLAPCVEACESLVLASSDGDFTIHHLTSTIHFWLNIGPPDDLLTDSAGARFRLSDYNGKVVLVNFWASWCAPCKAEIPWFVEFQREYAKDGFEVVGISLDEAGWKVVRPAIDSAKINYRVALGDAAIAKGFGGGPALPQTFLLNRKGVISARHTGIVSKSDYESEIRHLLHKGESSPDLHKTGSQSQ
jgi:cytochrome c biogenesis protein CcmG/thiol:disulfide interchange protein DsbE